TKVINYLLKDYYDFLGILHSTSTLFVHEQNRVAEHKNHTIAGMGLSMMADASVMHSFWGKVFLVVIYFFNCYSSDRLATHSSKSEKGCLVFFLQPYTISTLTLAFSLPLSPSSYNLVSLADSLLASAMDIDLHLGSLASIN
ncbi:hypothetical protein HK096_009280, partial [Nowakowskiella sp. JEL0078]